MDYIGRKSGKLIVVGISDNKYVRPNGKRETIFITKCECGNVHEVNCGNLKNTHSCGCSKRRKSNQVYINRVYKFYYDNAKRKGHDFELEFDELIEMTQQSCHYCGCKPLNNYKLANDGFEFKYNGIDRVDNSKGYVVGNVVPCCKMCNAMKSNLDPDEFLAQVKKICDYRVKK